MPLKIVQFDTLAEAEFYLRGGIKGGKQSLVQGVVRGLDGLTLIFSKPLVGTVTFSDPTGAGLTLTQIQTAINAVQPALQVGWAESSLHLIENTPSAGVALSKSGTANTAFGFSAGTTGVTDTVGTVFNGATGAIPRVMELAPKARLDGFFALVEVST